MQHALNKDYKEWQNEIKTLIPGIAGDEPAKKDTEDTSKSLEKLYQTFRGNYVKFKLNANDRQNNTETGLNHLIYTDASLIQHYIPRRESGTTVLTFLDISLAIDGMSGLSCGEYFQIDGIPEVYNDNGYFQITNVKHSLNENQWKTVIEASYLLKSIDVPGSKTNLNDGKAYKERPVPPEKPKTPTPVPAPPAPPTEVPRATGTPWENLFYSPFPGFTTQVPAGYYKGIDGKLYVDKFYIAPAQVFDSTNPYGTNGTGLPGDTDTSTD
jgi:hypothetical protein